MIALFKSIPLYVYFFFALFLLIGIRARSKKYRTRSVQFLFMYPFFIAFFNFLCLSRLLEDERLYLLLFSVIGNCVGVYLGWLLVKNVPIKVDDHYQIILTASNQPLILIVIFIVCRLVFIYNYLNHPMLFTPLFIIDALTSGIFTGILIGRAVRFYDNYKKEIV